jgi:hypothetical protein
MRLERAYKLIQVLLQVWNGGKEKRLATRKSQFEAQYQQACDAMGRSLEAPL